MRGKQRHTIHFSRGKSFSVDELYDCFYDELVLWADTILNDMGEAEDLVQDFFGVASQKQGGVGMRAFEKHEICRSGRIIGDIGGYGKNIAGA